MAVAMRVLYATVETVKPDATTRRIPVAEFHRLPGDTPHIETMLERGEFITAVTLPPPVGGKHLYRKGFATARPMPSPWCQWLRSSNRTARVA